MPKRRRLSDLYVVGKEVTFTDPDGSLSVWVQKLNQVEHETAYRTANAKRARTFAAYADNQSDEHQGLWSEIEEMALEDIIELLAQSQMASKRPALEAEIEAEEEWSKDNYLQGLQDAWDGGLSDAFSKNPEDPDAKRVFAELQRFMEAVDERVSGETERIRKDLKGQAEPELKKQMFQSNVRLQADLAWLQEFRRCEIWLSVRESDNHRERYFESRAEVDDLTKEVLDGLGAAYREISVDVVEGKASEETPSSSTPSESADKAEVA